MNINFTPLRDMILVRPDPKATHEGLIYFPDGAVQAGHEAGKSSEGYRDDFIGTVVAIGPGDKKLPFNWKRCWKCGQKRVHQVRTAAVTAFRTLVSSTCRCGKVSGASLKKTADEWNAQGDRYPMLTKVGDRVVYPRRPTLTNADCDVLIDGELFVMMHEEQNAFAVIEA
jgi:hypothetical protein